jgi:hypothetical protein
MKAHLVKASSGWTAAESILIEVVKSRVSKVCIIVIISATIVARGGRSDD